MSIQFRCLKCNYLLQTDDSAAGKQARCPQCSAIMQVPHPEPAAGTGSPNPFSDTSEASPFGGTPTSDNPYGAPKIQDGSLLSHAQALGRVRPPAIGLIMSGIIGILGSCLMLFGFLVQVIEGDPIGEEDYMALGLVVATLAAHVLILIGGVRLYSLKNHGVVLTASILGLFPCNCCWILSAGFALWALIVISNSAIQSHFDQAPARF